MSNSLPQGQQQQKVTSNVQIKSAEALQAQAQLREIRQKRVAYKEFQTRVKTGRAIRQTLLSEREICARDLENIETIGTYVKRKIEFYTVACGVLQKEIQDARNNRFHAAGPRDYLDEEWLGDTNADLLAEITSYRTITEVENKEKLEELRKRALATEEYEQRKMLMDNRIEQLRVDAHNTVRDIRLVKRDRDDLRLFMHEHANRTFQTANDQDSYTRRQETTQSLRSLEHRITFVCDLNESKVREICSAYRCWLARIRKDNSVLYETIAAAWKWTPRNKLANSCRRVKHKWLHQGTQPEQTTLLDEQIAAVEKMLTLCDLQRDNFLLNVKLSYSELVANFLLVMRTVLEDQNGAVT